MNYRCPDCGYLYLLDCFCEGDRFYQEVLVKAYPNAESEDEKRRKEHRRQLEKWKRMNFQRYR